MVILGLTGSIGMGKSTAAAALRRLGVPVYDADGTIHRLIRRGGLAVPLVAEAFPGVVSDGMVDRRRLGDLVFADRTALKRLEAILHPLARRAQLGFLAAAARRRARLVVLDIPLLFETRGDRRCDAVALLSAPPAIQEARVMARPGMTREKLAGIRKRQMPDAEKRRRADFVVPTGLTKRDALRRLGAIVRAMRARRGRHWKPGAAGT
ncbi:MAG: dephospho-CoA kinase [Alphaproteobacteria bacterium]|nr:dephospho-CoA kinase [Alphaproteobacteria bacterium]